MQFLLSIPKTAPIINKVCALKRVSQWIWFLFVGRIQYTLYPDNAVAAISSEYISLSDVHITNCLFKHSTFIKPSMAKRFLKKKSCWTTIVRILGLIGEGTNVFAANMKLFHNRFSWLSLDWVIQSTNPKGKSEASVMACLQKSSMCKK